jgi:tetratricopeptide (TPR) repeat protein
MKLGEVLQKQGLLEDGMSCLIQALQIKPSAWNVYFKITEFLELQNNLNAANACRLYQKLPKDLLNKCCQLTGDYELTSDSINRINKINIYPPSKHDIIIIKVSRSNSKVNGRSRSSGIKIKSRSRILSK